jgi:Flp pilus assembly protein TadB
MKRPISFLIVLLLCAAAFAEKNAPQEQDVKEHLQQEMNKLEQQEARIKINEKKLELARRERMIESQRQLLLHGSLEYDPEKQQCLRDRRFQYGQRHLRMIKLFLGFTFFVVLAVALINILLTILVFADMKKRNSFNGLWIPVILLGGVITIIGYALFRNTDTAIQE